MTASALTALCGATPEELQALVADLGEPSFRAKQLHRQMYVRGVFDPVDMSDLPKQLRAKLADHVRSGVPAVHDVQRASDGTRKILFELDDGKRVESVLIPMRSDSGTTLTQCVSTQVGCTLDCGFCLTGSMGLLRNLTAGEIVGQVVGARALVDEGEAVTRYVYMGMGEPLANYDAVVRSLDVLGHPEGMGISGRRITVSTAGMVNKIKRFGEETRAMLAVSVNATTDEQRDAFMPRVNAKWNLKTLIEALQDFPMHARRRLTVEYVLLAGENDSDADARRLVGLLHRVRTKINLIPYNPHPASPYGRPSRKRVRAFQRILLDAGYATSVRETKGDDVLAACGQLGVPGNRPS